MEQPRCAGNGADELVILEPGDGGRTEGYARRELGLHPRGEAAGLHDVHLQGAKYLEDEFYWRAVHIPVRYVLGGCWRARAALRVYGYNGDEARRSDARRHYHPQRKCARVDTYGSSENLAI